MEDNNINILKSNIILFNNNLVELLQILLDLCINDTKMTAKLTKYYKYYINIVNNDNDLYEKRIKFIEDFLKYYCKYNKEISIKDECIFGEEEQYYKNQPIQILKSIDFKLIWCNITDDNIKDNIWNLLHKLYVLASHIIDSVDKKNKLVKDNKNILNDLLTSMYLEKQIILESEKEELCTSEEDQFSNIMKFFGEGNIILDILKDIMKKLNINKSSNPLEGIKYLFGNNGEKFKDILINVIDILKEKLSKNEINQDELLANAKRMGEMFGKKLKNVKGMPDFSLFNKSIIESLFPNVNADEELKTSDNIEKENAEKIKNLNDMLKSNIEQLKQFGDIGLDIDIDNIMKNLYDIKI